MREKRTPILKTLYILGLTACIVITLCLLFSIEVSYILGSFRTSEIWNERWFRGGHVQEGSKDQCKEHHIAMVLGGYSVVIRAYSLLKSILFHHKGPLVFHFITDEESAEVLPTLFDTWEIPDVKYHIYDMTSYKTRVEWIPNTHYSASFGLIKLVIPDILPNTVEEVLLLDSDLIVLNDISPIFDMFQQTNESVFFAMGENISPWYEQATPTMRRWPARGRGYNSGVVLVNAKRMRAGGWNTMWKDETEKTLRDFGKVQLADQDIFNAVTVSHPEVVIDLPCEYNYQLGFQSKPLSCTNDTRDVKIAHFNSPKKKAIYSKYVMHFTQAYSTFQAMDGNIFRMRSDCRKVANANQFDLTSLPFESLDECAALYTAIRTTYRTHRFINKFKMDVEPGDVTMVTQFSVDRIEIFEKVLQAWTGPVSAAVYCTDAELVQIGEYMDASQMTRGRTNIALHAVFKTGKYYPINYLRNVALNASKTDYAYLADVDFVPSRDLYITLKETVKSTNMTMRALVVPAFEFTFASGNMRFPETKEELIESWDENKVQTFRSSIWPSGHNATDYDKWRNANESYEVDWQPGYEPYTVIARNSTPMYDERFVGFGWNKVAHLMTLHAQGFKFEVVSSGFTVHHPHLPSFEIIRYRGSAIYRKCMRILRSEFARDLHFQMMTKQMS